MKLKKVITGSLVLAAAATWAGAATSASAEGELAAGGAKDINVDPQAQVLEVTPGDDSKEILFAVVKPSKKGEVKVTSWDVYEGSGVTKIDLSSLNNAKDNYIAVMTDDGTSPAFIKIPAAQSAAVEFDGSAATPELKVGFGDKPASAKSATKATTGFEYRTALGSWTAVKDTDTTPDWSAFQQQGAVLYFRAPGVTKTDAKPVAGEEKLKLAGADDSTATAVYVTKSLPGKEVKFKIAKRANGPSLSADYVKGTVKLPKNAEYRVNVGDVVANSEAKAVAAGDFFSTDALKELDSVSVEARTAADKSKKKPASKWSRIVVAKPAGFGSGLTVGDVVAKDSGTTANGVTSYGGGGVAKSTLKEGTGDAAVDLIKVEYEETGSGDKKAYTNVKVTNKSSYIFQIIVQEGETVPAADAKVTATVKAGATATLKKVADGKVVFIRKAGDKKTQTWVGTYEKLGVVDYPKTEKAASSEEDA